VNDDATQRNVYTTAHELRASVCTYLCELREEAVIFNQHAF